MFTLISVQCVCFYPVSVSASVVVVIDVLGAELVLSLVPGQLGLESLVFGQGVGQVLLQLGVLGLQLVGFLEQLVLFQPVTKSTSKQYFQSF